MILNIIHQQAIQYFVQTMNSQKTPHISPLQVRYGASFVSSLEKIFPELSGIHFIFVFLQGHNLCEGLSDTQKADMKAYMSLADRVLGTAQVRGVTRDDSMVKGSWGQFRYQNTGLLQAWECSVMKKKLKTFCRGYPQENYGKKGHIRCILVQIDNYKMILGDLKKTEIS